MSGSLQDLKVRAPKPASGASFLLFNLTPRAHATRLTDGSKCPRAGSLRRSTRVGVRSASLRREPLRHDIAR
jgi:hypothetical protein